MTSQQRLQQRSANTPSNASEFWDEALIHRYDLTGPRYTSYPTAVEFTDTYGPSDFVANAEASQSSGRPLSLYTHLPFCAHLCYYCACNKVITKKRDKALPYVDRLLKEARLQARLFGPHRPVRQLHWGGGTPTFLPDDVMQRLMDGYLELFNLQWDEARDYSIEIDPREVGEHTLGALWYLGFNRISLGVQDLNPQVQKAVNRIQPRAMTEAVLTEARQLGFNSINLDLIYGLPYQTPESFAETLEHVIEMSPDRLSIFSYAHLPARFYPQTRIQADTLPSPAQKLTILQNTINRLLQAGYVYIGMDHFAKPNDSLAVAQRDGRLHRNFQGYTTHGDCDLVSLGVSAIGQTEHAYFQNLHDLPAYEASIDAGQLATHRGVRLSRDDRLRRWTINRLICQFELDRALLRETWGEDFDTYFAPEYQRLQPMLDDGLLTDSGGVLKVMPKGRLLIRAICQVFDRYRQADPNQRFSRII
ncbi:oxygen-independent coproporphyrinogen III oxidase [Marinobacter nanhaiticus D15-8W]|uniref:Coproporphyrinogen-III oxidase n=1 Tax=Marinobacter nanhaiticus D15-8W TaxID=626887 RepID=N6WXR0_9GAMM|nr:oxygen-independent coproporphyrinogen III oxidase [Marinobacter nanhaiticus]ENO16386.1 oxygen-independent coproporphyrinogen III oxidase [Marinobacter nanhaiticus D15-8W]BES72753.1 oxygen-independent coproporphyrinogen III oxidase [Marinobacter nanhaiticus D15-8W]